MESAALSNSKDQSVSLDLVDILAVLLLLLAKSDNEGGLYKAVMAELDPIALGLVRWPRTF